MRYFFDTEFIEDGKTIELISIAIVNDQDEHLYLCNSECDLSRANPWVQENVIPLLPGPGEGWKTREEIRKAVLEFAPPRTGPDFWAYYADYDWVVFCQLFGRMIDLPSGYPMYCRDLKQAIDSAAERLNIPLHVLKDQFPKQTREHDALDDAQWNLKVFQVLESNGYV